MIILLPIFSLPQPGIHSEKLCRLVRQYAEIAEGQLVVCTDKQEVLESVRNLKISCFRSDAPCLQDQTSIFPIGTGESLRCLEQQVPQLAADPVIALINYRAPVIPAKILSQAYQRFVDHEETVLFSVAPVIDHPAQANAPYLLHDVELISRFDRLENCCGIGGESGKWISSRPFFFDWSPYRHGDAAVSQIYTMSTRGFWAVMEPFQADQHVGTGQTIFSVLSQYSASRLLARNNEMGEVGSRINGLPVFTREIRYLLVETEKDNALCLYLREDVPYSAMVLRIWPYRGQQIVTSQCCEVSLPKNGVEASGCPTVQYGRANYFSTGWHLGHADAIDGVIVALVEPTEGNFADFFEPYEHDFLWQIDPIRRARINKASGREIHGRQELPEIYELDHKLCLFRKENWPYLEDLIEQGRAVGFVLPLMPLSTITSQPDEVLERETEQGHSGMGKVAERAMTATSTPSVMKNHIPLLMHDLPILIQSQLTLPSEHTVAENDDYAAAMERLACGIRSEATHKLAMVNSIYAFLSRHEPEQAIHRYSLVDIVRRARESVLYHLDSLQESAEKRALAKRNYFLTKGQALFQSGQYDKALEIWLRVLQVEPDNTFIHQKLSKLRAELAAVEQCSEFQNS